MTHRTAAATVDHPERYQAGTHVIQITASVDGHYVVHVENSTGGILAPLTRAWGTHGQAIASARNAYRHFADGGRAIPTADGGLELVAPAVQDAVVVPLPRRSANAGAHRYAA